MGESFTNIHRHPIVEESGENFWKIPASAGNGTCDPSPESEMPNHCANWALIVMT